MNTAPRTMTELGLRYLEALAAEATGGVFLELGPLFGSSTNAIARGRRIAAPIHTIDTFAPAPWVKKRFGIDLNRAVFDKFTAGISNLIVHHGLAPDVVRHGWQDDIGFYFDDATHGDPGWSANFNFFAPFFRGDAILCGDDFAGGWPDIVRNVTSMAETRGLRLYVMGRVWAMTGQDDARIRRAIDTVCPALAGVTIATDHGDPPKRLPAAVWSSGLHAHKPLIRAKVQAAEPLPAVLIARRDGREIGFARLGEDIIRFRGADQFELRTEGRLAIQFCLLGENGRTENTRAYRSGQVFALPPGAHIAAMRLSA